MTRLLHGFTCLVGLCAITLVVGCGSSSSKKTNPCDGSGCTDAKKDVAGETAKDVVSPDRPDSRIPDGGTLDTTPVQEGGTVDTQVGDTPVVGPDGPAIDTTPVIPDTRPDTILPDTRTPDTQRDTTPDSVRDTLPPDTIVDTAVLLDVPADTTVDAAVTDAPLVDAPASEAGLEAGDDAEGDAEVDAT